MYVGKHVAVLLSVNNIPQVSVFYGLGWGTKPNTWLECLEVKQYTRLPEVPVCTASNDDKVDGWSTHFVRTMSVEFFELYEPIEMY